MMGVCHFCHVFVDSSHDLMFGSQWPPTHKMLEDAQKKTQGTACYVGAIWDSTYKD
jgi:hypothetical protein